MFLGRFTAATGLGPTTVPLPDVAPIQIFASTGRWGRATDPRACGGIGPCAVAVGNFDGVHVGHAAIVGRLLANAVRLGVPAVALTFDPHPARILRPDQAPAALTLPQRRAELLAGLGVDATVVQPTDARLVALEPEVFFSQILRGGLQAQALVEGSDFRFGARRRGDVTLLAGLAQADGVELEVVPPVVIDGEPVSSSRIRTLIAAGSVAAARQLLTAPYRLQGLVVTGRQRGRTIGFPTANLGGVATLLPAEGVYAARAGVAGADRDWPAAVHIGPNVSFGETSATVEVHLIGFSGDLYGKSLHVDFLRRVRETRRFDSVEALKAQLAADVALAASG